MRASVALLLALICATAASGKRCGKGGCQQGLEAGEVGELASDAVGPEALLELGAKTGGRISTADAMAGLLRAALTLHRSKARRHDREDDQSVMGPADGASAWPAARVGAPTTPLALAEAIFEHIKDYYPHEHGFPGQWLDREALMAPRRKLGSSAKGAAGAEDAPGGPGRPGSGGAGGAGGAGGGGGGGGELDVENAPHPDEIMDALSELDSELAKNSQRGMESTVLTQDLVHALQEEVDTETQGGLFTHYIAHMVNRTGENLDAIRESWNEVVHMQDTMRATVEGFTQLVRKFGHNPNARPRTGTMVAAMVDVRATSEGWTQVLFERPFEHGLVPAVIMSPVNLWDKSPMTFRVRNVTSRGFEVLPTRPHPYPGHNIRRLPAYYLAITPGNHILPDGTLIEAGIAGVQEVQAARSCGHGVANGKWKEINFHTHFHRPPALLTGIVSTNNEAHDPPKRGSAPFLTVAVRHIGNRHASIALERGRARSGSLQYPEFVAWVAVQQRVGMFMDHRWHDIRYESMVSFPQVESVHDTKRNSYVGMRQVFGVEPLAFVSPASRVSPEGGFVRLVRASRYHTWLRWDNSEECQRGRKHDGVSERVSAFQISDPGRYPLFEQWKIDFMHPDRDITAISEDHAEPDIPAEVVEQAGASASAEENPGVNMEAGWAQMKDTRLDPRFTKIRFKQTYRVPPLVFLLMGPDGGSPAAIRIRKITRSFFEASVVEPPDNNGPHAFTMAAYVAIEPGKHTLPDGTVLEAGSIPTTQAQFDTRCVNGSTGWESIKFSTEFKSTPALVAQIQTMANEQGMPPATASMPFLTTAVRGLTAAGAQLALERSRVAAGGALRFNETIAYLAVEQGGGHFTDKEGGSVQYEVSMTAEVLRGTGSWCEWNAFRTLFLRWRVQHMAPVALSTLVTRFHPQGGWLRWCGHHRWTQHWATRVRIDLDTACTFDRTHGSERGSLLVFSKPFALFTDKLPAQLPEGVLELPEEKRPLRLEVGVVTMKSTRMAQTPTKVWFENAFPEPPLVFLTPGHNDRYPTAIRVVRVDAEFMEVTLVGPPGFGGAHRHAQTAPYIAVSPGSYQLPDGTRFEAGSINTTSMQFDPECVHGPTAEWTEVKFKRMFESAPAVITQLESLNSEVGRPPHTASQPWFTVAQGGTSMTGVKVALERSHVSGPVHMAKPETIAYFAIQNKKGGFDAAGGAKVLFEANSLSRVAPGWSRWPHSRSCGWFPFQQTFPRLPMVLAHVASRYDRHGGWLRQCALPSTRGLHVVIDTDMLCTMNYHQRPHDKEDIAYVAFSQPFGIELAPATG